MCVCAHEQSICATSMSVSYVHSDRVSEKYMDTQSNSRLHGKPVAVPPNVFTIK